MAEILAFVGAWQNLPYSLMLLACIGLAVLQLAGLGGEAEGDADADGDADVDADADAPAFATLFAFIGFGKVPIAIILLLLLGIAGICGWTLHLLAQRVFGSLPPGLLLVSLPISTVLAVLGTSRIARVIGRALPPVLTSAVRADQLIGRRGDIISGLRDGRPGVVRVRDDGGTMINIFANWADGIGPPGTVAEVLLVEYLKEGNVYLVNPVLH